MLALKKTKCNAIEIIAADNLRQAAITYMLEAVQEKSDNLIYFIFFQSPFRLWKTLTNQVISKNVACVKNIEVVNLINRKIIILIMAHTTFFDITRAIHTSVQHSPYYPSFIHHKTSDWFDRQSHVLHSSRHHWIRWPYHYEL